MQVIKKEKQIIHDFDKLNEFLLVNILIICRNQL
jgi:hypothetical protein